MEHVDDDSEEGDAEHEKEDVSRDLLRSRVTEKVRGEDEREQDAPEGHRDCELTEVLGPQSKERLEAEMLRVVQQELPTTTSQALVAEGLK